MASLDARLRSSLHSRRARANLRSLDPVPLWAISPGVAPKLSEDLVDFSSNDYLSLALSSHLRDQLQLHLLHSPLSPFGPSSSRLLDGNTALHRSLESDLAKFFLAPAGLLFNSGFDANVGIWSSLPGPEDWIVYDRMIHASVHDGLRLCRSPPSQRQSFIHNSVSDLEAVLKAILSDNVGISSGRSNVFIAVESLYSMDGDLCPLQEMTKVVERLFGSHGNAHLVVDEAHSTGLYGLEGRGLVCALSLAGQIAIRLHTFGKAAACSGAIVLCSPLVREYLINYARPLIFSTTMTRMNVMMIRASISEFQSESRLGRARQLELLSAHLSRQLEWLLHKHQIQPVRGEAIRPPNVTLTVLQTSLQPPRDGLYSPIVPILSGDPRGLARFLYHGGFLLRPIGTPTVPRGRELVRICLHANQTVAQIEGLIGMLDQWISQHLPQTHL